MTPCYTSHNAQLAGGKYVALLVTPAAVVAIADLLFNNCVCGWKLLDCGARCAYVGFGVRRLPGFKGHSYTYSIYSDCGTPKSAGMCKPKILKVEDTDTVGSRVPIDRY